LLQAHQDAPYVVRYSIDMDETWRTRAVQVEVENDGRHRTSLLTDGSGRWSRDAELLPDVDRCLDVDLEWSPSTNTLPIRRLGLAFAQTTVVTAAWVRFPSLEVQRLEQSYERLDERRYRYRSGRFTADLEVDDDGVVLQYG